MKAPSDFDKNKLCRLKKTLYGQKQSPRAWFGRFTKGHIRDRYKQSQGRHTLFKKHLTIRGVTILMVCVDDIIVTSNNLEKQDLL